MTYTQTRKIAKVRQDYNKKVKKQIKKDKEDKKNKSKNGRTKNI